MNPSAILADQVKLSWENITPLKDIYSILSDQVKLLWENITPLKHIDR